MTTFNGPYSRLIAAMRNGVLTYEHILADPNDAEKTTYRDTGDGWTVLEALCHVRDFDEIFFERARQIAAAPASAPAQLVPVDHDALVVERAYNTQDPAAVMQAFKDNRMAFVAFFEAVDDAAWGKVGHHPERGAFSLADALLQVVTHDLTHLEQVTRTLRERRTA